MRSLTSGLLALLLLAGAEANGQDAAMPVFDRALIVVLDASGSMKESVVGGVKSDLAQRGLLRTLARLPAETGVGLRLLGEGDEEDDECVASRRAIPFAEFEADRWRAALNAIRWRGATPLSHSIREALADLRGVQARRKEILVLSDGEETCGHDPIGTARHEVEGVRIHTISLGERVSHQLAGIALVTSGSYSIAFDDTTFGEATADSLPDLPRELPDADNISSGSPGGGVLEVILDVSNSMWGQVDGRVKMELAREALRGALAELPTSVPVGLRAYGHRVLHEDKQRGCQDTQLLMPPTPNGASRVLGTADGLSPRGQTPIALSLRAAGEDLRAAGGHGTLLLISDGIESCGGDPVAVAEELRASGLRVVLHTVGLGVNAEAAASLGALASAGGGQYFNALTAEELMSGVGVAVRTSRDFILSEQELSGFPSTVTRVQGGDSVQEAELLEPGYYSFRDHLFNQQRYFAVRGTPGKSIALADLAPEIGSRLRVRI